MTVRLKRLDNIDVVCTDVDRLVDFYGGLLGLELRLPYEPGQGWAGYRAGDVVIYFIEDREAGEHPAPRRTGVLVLSPDARTPLYSATYRGPLLTSIPSAVPATEGVYLANLSLGGPRGSGGVVRLRWPAELRPHDHEETP